MVAATLIAAALVVIVLSAAELGIGVLIESAACGVAAAVEHLHFAGDDFSGVTITAVLGLPFTGAQCAFNVNLAAFFQIFARDFAKAIKEYDAPPDGMYFTSGSWPTLPIKITLLIPRAIEISSLFDGVFALFGVSGDVRVTARLFAGRAA